MRTRKPERTVTALLSLNNRGIKAKIQQIMHNDLPRHTYVYCRSTAIAKRFLADAEKEGFLFADGKAPKSINY